MEAGYQANITNIKSGKPVTVYARAYDSYEPEIYAQVKKTFTNINRDPTIVSFGTANGTYNIDETISFNAVVTDDVDVTTDYTFQVCINTESNCFTGSSLNQDGANANKFTFNIPAEDIGHGSHEYWVKVTDALGGYNKTSETPIKQLTIADNHAPSVRIITPEVYTEYEVGDLIEIIIEAVDDKDQDGYIDRIEVAYGSSKTLIGCYSADISDENCQSIKAIGNDQYSLKWIDNYILDVPNGQLFVTAIDNENAKKTPLSQVSLLIKSLAPPPSPKVKFDTLISPDGDGRYKVIWAPSFPTERYLLERCDHTLADCETSEGEWERLAQLENFQTEFQEAGLPEGEFYYRVTACAVNDDAVGGELVKCNDNPGPVGIMTVIHTAPTFPFLGEYLFTANPTPAAGDFSLTWALLEEAEAGALVEDYRLYEKTGGIQCNKPDNNGFCEDEWHPIDLAAAVIDEQEGTMKVFLTNRAQGSYVYRLEACNNQSGCTAGPYTEVTVFPPMIDSVELACEGECLRVEGQYLDNDALIQLKSQHDQVISVIEPEFIKSLSEQLKEIDIGEDTEFNRALRIQGLEVRITNPGGGHDRAVLGANQQSSAITLSEADLVLSKNFDVLYATIGDKVHAISIADGEPIESPTLGWPFTVPDTVLTTPVVNQITGDLYVGSTDTRLYAVDTEGFSVWQTKTDGAVLAQPVLGEASAIYTGSMDGNLYAFHPDNGNVVWQRFTDSSGISQKPKLHGDDLIYVTTASGQVHLINRRELDRNTLVWNSVDDSLLAYELQVGNWQPQRLYNMDDYLTVSKVYRLLLQPELPVSREILTFWTFALDQGVHVEAVIKAFLESETGARSFPVEAPMGTNQKFLQALYKRAFGEDAVDVNDYSSLTVQGATYAYTDLLAMLNDEIPREDIVMLFISSVEYSQATHAVLNAQYDYLYEENFSWTTVYCEAATCDSDNDGLYDWWEELYFGNVNAVTAADEVNGVPVGVSFQRDENPCQAEGCIDIEQPDPIKAVVLPDPESAEVLASDEIGAIVGQFGVNEAGAATYQVPVVVAPGVAGVTPEIALSYNSQSKNGPVGIGWGISGLSAITRCRQTLSVDGEAKPLTWTNEDRLCLDGQRLVSISGDNSYHLAETKYKTEIDSDVLVTQKQSGPATYFIVQRKDGSVSTYGRSDNAKQANSDNVGFAWGLEGFRDSVGSNYDIQYTYLSQTASHQSLLISHIDYAYGLDGQSGASIQFNYESNRFDPLSGYTSGEWFGTDKRLKRIVSYSDDTSGVSTEIRRFNLSYKPSSDFNPISKLQSIEECVGTVCKASKMTFGWTEPRIHYQSPIINHTDTDDVGIFKYQPADINGDGLMDLIWLQWRYQPQQDDTEHRFNYMISDGTNLKKMKFYDHENPSSVRSYLGFDDNIGSDIMKIQPLDYNADGRHDALMYRELGNSWRVYLSYPNASGEWRLTSRYMAIPADESGYKLPEATQFVDVNSDGLADAVYFRDNKIHVRYMELNPSEVANSATPYHFSKSPDTFSTSIAFSELNIPDNRSDKVTTKYDLLQESAGDFNGDGVVDFVLGKRTEACKLEEKSNGKTSTFCDYAYQYILYTIENSGQKRVKSLHEIIAKTETGSVWVKGETAVRGRSCSRASGACTRNTYTVTIKPKKPPLKLTAQDINSDGLVDLLYTLDDLNPGNDEYFYQINNGVSFETPVSIGRFKEKASPRLTDFNQDGYLDLIWIDRGAHLALWNQQDKAFDITVVDDVAVNGNYSFGNYSANNGFMLLDMNGDAVQDVFVANFGRETFEVSLASKVVGDYWENGEFYYRGELNSGKAHMITSIDNGFGSRTDITYESIATSDHYTDLHLRDRELAPALLEDDDTYVMPSTSDAPEFYAKVNADLPVPNDAQSLARDKQHPIFDVRAPMYVVTDVESRRPTAVMPGVTNQNDKGIISYYYANAKLQAAGRGMLGFEKVKSLSHDTNILTTTHYRQDFPFIGMAWKSEQKLLGGNLLNVSINDWVVQGWDGEQNSFPEAPYRLLPKASSTTSYDAYTNTPLKTVDMTYEDESLGDDQQGFDSEGNPRLIKEVTTDHVNSLTFTKLSENTYVDSTLGRRYGRLKHSKVTHSRTGEEDIIRESDFSYQGSANGHWMLVRETVDPGLPSEVSTVYSYDAVGNTIKTVTAGRVNAAGNKHHRETRIEFDEKGRYPIKTYNALGQLVETIVTRLPSGQVTQVQDANGNIATVLYSPMGRKFFESNETGNFTKMLVKEGGGYYCDNQNTQYHMQTESADGSKGFICYDYLGREVKAGKLGFKGYEWYTTETGYDHLGRVAYKSLPFEEQSEDPQYLTYQYDVYGRAIRSGFPDGSEETFNYNLLTVTATNRKGNTRTETRNVLEELITVTDALGGSIEHRYDAVGNLIASTTDGLKFATGLSGAITVTMKYDEQGRYKIEMDDPDKGFWTYNNNAFGELIEQIDARGRSTTITRDKLGREVCRNDYLGEIYGPVESSTRWYYDTAPKTSRNGSPSKAIGLLHRTVKADGACSLSSTFDETENYPFVETYTYDPFARNTQTITTIDSHDFTQRITFDEIGRVFQTFDASGADRGVRTIYNDSGYISEIRDAQGYNLEQKIYRKILEMDARGKVVQELHNNGITTTREYDPITGMATEIQSGMLGLVSIQDQSMKYDVLGNLEQRIDRKRGTTENFCYDAINRMTGQALNDSCTGTEITYDSFGNFMYKPGTGTYTYGENAGPHAVTSVELNGEVTTYQYDANGNMISDSTGRTLVYSQFDKPTQITKGNTTVEFEYGPGRSRYKRVDTDGDSSLTTYYVGNVEIKVTDGDFANREAKRQLGSTLITETELDTERSPLSEAVTLAFIFTDHLGSVDIIVGENPSDASSQTLMSFDAWGKRRQAETLEDGFNLADILNEVMDTTTRGFTGHEMLDAVGLIHMNGRVYDAHLGRFLSADPYIQAPTETQSFNRYAYVWNNPMSATDPSGYWNNAKMWGAIGQVLQVVGSVLMLTKVPPLVLIGAALYVVGGFAVGESMNSGAKGAFTAVIGLVVSAAAGYASDQIITGASQSLIGSSLGATAARIGISVAVHAVISGAISHIQGGSFLKGAAAGGVRGFASGALPNKGAGGAISAIIVGGTTSRITGGKFANGAVTAAMSYAASSFASSGAETTTDETLANEPLPNENYSDYIYRTQGREVVATLTLEEVTNFSAGLGDALTLGAGPYLRDWLDIGGVDTSSTSYKVGSYSALLAGGARLTYAGAVKGYSYVASSGAAASAFRSRAKTVFRGGAGKNWRPVDVSKYGSDAALRAAAGRSNPYINTYGAGATAAGFYNPD